MRHIIFFDFSFNNTAICKFDVVSKKYEYYLLANHFSYSNSEIGKPLETVAFKDIINISDNYLRIFVYKKKPMSRPKGDPTSFCRYMLDSCKDVSDFFQEILTKYVLVDVNLENIIFGIEDYAIGIKTNNATETAEMVYSCKSKLYSMGVPLESFHFFQPQGIKSITGNGNATKQMMLDYFIKKDIKNNDVHKSIGTHHKKYRYSNNKVKKPIEDLVDSFCGVQAIRNKLNL